MGRSRGGGGSEEVKMVEKHVKEHIKGYLQNFLVDRLPQDHVDPESLGMVLSRVMEGLDQYVPPQELIERPAAKRSRHSGEGAGSWWR